MPVGDKPLRFPLRTTPIYSNAYSRRPSEIDCLVENRIFPDTEFSQYQLNLWQGYMRDAELEIPLDKESKNLLRQLFLHTIHMVQEQFEMLPADYDFSKETWFEKTSYTEYEKESLRKEFEQNPELLSKDFICKCFCKQETYPEIKPARPIKSRTDRFKYEVGPEFQAINEILFKHRFFIKKIPLPDRPKYMSELLNKAGVEIDCTDFSKFESHFITIIMRLVEFVFYSYVLFNNKSHHDKMMKICNQVLAAKQIFQYKYFTTSFQATRASGEMCTSSGNGITNFILYTFLCHLKRAVHFAAVFEGDDGASQTMPEESRPTTNDYYDIGWFCKMESFKSFSEASFCGIVSDSEELINITDPFKAVAEVGWTQEKYAFASKLTHLALIRAKGYSMVYQFYRCPILDSLGRYMLRITEHAEVERRMKKLLEKGGICDSYKREILKIAINSSLPPKREIGPKTRELMSRKYNVSEADQVEVERYFDSLNKVQELEPPMDFPELWTKMFELYVIPGSDKQFNLELNSKAEDYLVGLEQLVGPIGFLKTQTH